MIDRLDDLEKRVNVIENCVDKLHRIIIKILTKLKEDFD